MLKKETLVFNLLSILILVTFNVVVNFRSISVVSMPFPIYAFLPYDDDCVAIRDDCYENEDLLSSKFLWSGLFLSVIYILIYVFGYRKSTFKHRELVFIAVTLVILLLSPILAHFFFYWQ